MGGLNTGPMWIKPIQYWSLLSLQSKDLNLGIIKPLPVTQVHIKAMTWL